MPYDYARDNGYRRRERQDQQQRNRSPIFWLVVGMVLGFSMAVGLYLAGNATVKKMSSKTLARQLQQQAAADKANKKDSKSKNAQTAENTETSEKPKFDFYKILPNSEANKTPQQTGEAEQKGGHSKSSHSEGTVTSNTPSTASTTHTDEDKVIHPENPSGAASSKQHTEISIADLEAAKLGVKNTSPPVTIKEEPVHNAPAKAPQSLAENDNKAQKHEEVAKRYMVRVTLNSYEKADALRAQLLLLGFSAKVVTVNDGAGIRYQVNLGPYPNEDEARAVQNNLRSNRVKSSVVRG